MKFNNIIKLFILGTLLVASGCTKKLDRKPYLSIDAATAITTAEDVEAALIGAYSVLAGGQLYGCNLIMIPDLQAAEGYLSWRGTFQGQRQISLKTMTRDNGEASRTWIAAYRAINMANIVLESIGVVKDPDQKNQFEGEALFIRGIMHFELVRMYGKPWGTTAANDHIGIVVKTKATYNEEAVSPRSTVKAAYDQAIADLTTAVTKLPDTRDGIRADKYVALAFLARLYMQQQDYAKALNAANQVIASGNYGMNGDVKEVFTKDLTDESIWEIEQDVQNNAGTSNDGMATFYASYPGIGRADIRLEQSFLDTYPAGDVRRAEWYYIGTGARPGNWYTSKWNAFEQNLPIIRIAEMYLIRAECNLRLGSSVGATPASDLAEVRNPSRVGLPVIAAPTLNDVLQERIYELAYEGVRIHDIKRLKGSTGAFAWNHNMLTFPIPQREIDASRNVITQNSGY